MNKVTYICGTGKNKDGFALLYSWVAMKLAEVQLRAARVFGGYTLLASEGGWVNSKDELVTEEGITFVVITDKPYLVCKSFAEELRDTFDQDSVVMVIERDVEVEFV